MGKHYQAKIGANGCYVITGHNMAIHLCPRETSKEQAEEISELLDQQYELGLIRGNNGHPHALAVRAPSQSKGATKVGSAQVEPFELRPYHEEVRRFLEQLFKLGRIPLDTPGRRPDVTLFFNAEMSFYSQLVELCSKLQVRLEAFAEQQGIELPEYWLVSRYTNDPDEPVAAHPAPLMDRGVIPSPGEGTHGAGSDNTKH